MAPRWKELTDRWAGGEESGRRNGIGISGGADGDYRGEGTTVMAEAIGDDGKRSQEEGGGATDPCDEAARVYRERPGLARGEICGALHSEHAEE